MLMASEFPLSLTRFSIFQWPEALFGLFVCEYVSLFRFDLLSHMVYSALVKLNEA
jgi:hypothetical protein